jgi:putative phage-type endonuclease
MIIQGSEEWHKCRLGKVTASRVADLLPGKKGAYLASRKNYIAEKVCEILTGNKTESFVSSAMDHGTETEPLARSAYEALMGLMVDEVGFIDHPNIKDFGASPDGLVNNDGCIEIKCPNTATHIDTLLNGTVKDQYYIQMQVVMMCCNRSWCDFISFDDRMPDNLQLFIKRFDRDNDLISDIEREVMKFQNELGVMIDRLNQL